LNSAGVEAAMWLERAFEESGVSEVVKALNNDKRRCHASFMSFTLEASLKRAFIGLLLPLFLRKLGRWILRIFALSASWVASIESSLKP